MVKFFATPPFFATAKPPLSLTCKDIMKKNEFLLGLKQSLPVFFGYLAVSFGFGALAIVGGLTSGQATLMSLTNITSAGQFAGLAVILEHSSLFTMFLTQLVINSRYALMSLALGQHLGPSFPLPLRFLVAFYNTDEIFALAMSREHPSIPYMLGLGILPIVGWTGGTLLGAVAGTVLPTVVRLSLSVALYGMFVAIVIPQAKKSRPILIAALTAILFSCLFTWVPLLNSLSSGLSIVLSTVLAAALAALLFPLSKQGEETVGEGRDANREEAIK